MFSSDSWDDALLRKEFFCAWMLLLCPVPNKWLSLTRGFVFPCEVLTNSSKNFQFSNIINQKFTIDSWGNDHPGSWIFCTGIARNIGLGIVVFYHGVIDGSLVTLRLGFIGRIPRILPQRVIKEVVTWGLKLLVWLKLEGFGRRLGWIGSLIHRVGAKADSLIISEY